ncbi:MAG: hypothetical protein FJZ90_04235, partial [Chloroflexi bacterium]|nr:hypothetical protein [Chloroflexota bacterium]
MAMSVQPVEKSAGLAGVCAGCTRTPQPGGAPGDGFRAFVIPAQEGWIIYRPLLQLAFVGNYAMAELALALGRGEAALEGASEELRGFLESVGFLQPDPPPPAPLRVNAAP